MLSKRGRVLATVLLTAVGVGAVAGSGSGAVAEGRNEVAAARSSGVVVSLGDSYISGEAGRWKGNSSNSAGDRNGTDRAFTGTGYDPTLVYGDSHATGCHRSDVAEVTRIPWLRPDAKINLACSGATTSNVLRTSAGGVPHDGGEPPQNDQLALVAAQRTVSTVVLSIGGNDLGFADIVTACVVAFISPEPRTPCRDAQQRVIDDRMPAMREAVARTIDDIRATLAAAGQRAGSYRIILQSYPVPLARAADLRHPESPVESRRDAGGCPILNADADWDLAQQIGDNLRLVAADRRVQFLDLRNAFRGHELCSAAAAQPDGTAPPRAASSEWIRWIDAFAQQGDLNESLHPNAFGQRALGRCLSLTLLLTRRDVSCNGVPGKSPSRVYLRTLH